MNEWQKKAFHEAKLAIQLAMKPEWFESVKRISDAIIRLIPKHDHEEGFDPADFEALEQRFAGEPLARLKAAVYRTFDKGTMGALVKDPDGLSLKDVLLDVKTELQMNTNLVTVMHLHATMGYSFARVLHEERYTQIRRIFEKFTREFESGKSEYRQIAMKESDIVPITWLGMSDSPDVHEAIYKLSETQQLISCIKATSHKNSLQRYAIDIEHPALKEFKDNQAPVIAGPSSHLLNLLMALELYENLFEFTFSAQEKHEYSLAYFAFFGVAGYHSFHEVMSVSARCHDLPYDMSQYEGNLPESIQEKMRTQFSAKVLPLYSFYSTPVPSSNIPEYRPGPYDEASRSIASSSSSM
ncbi:hypothetical protein [Legionella sp. CNM-4043-24]|uniref:hypothetical protein n=1 Tax=Legionella sp. CNM-4043-24 TaxID=3421646 RepID=UPI00403B0FFA